MERYFVDENGGAVSETMLWEEYPGWLAQNELSTDEVSFEQFVSNCLQSNGGTLQEVAPLRLEKEAALALLDRVEHFRRHHQDDAKHPADFCMRAISAIIAEAAGYGSRLDWCNTLKNRGNTFYTADLRDSNIYNW